MATSRQSQTTLHHARTITEEEFQGFAATCKKILTVSDRNRECVDIMRQLYQFASLNPNELKANKELVEQIYGILAEPQQGPVRLKLICMAFLREFSPSSLIEIYSFDAPVDPKSIPLILPVLLAQGAHFSLVEVHLSSILDWLTSLGVDFEVKIGAMDLLAALSTYHPDLLSPGVNRISEIMGDALRNASTSAATNPADRSVFSPSKQAAVLTELDGSRSRDIFTLLLQSKYYSSDQLLNIHVFSMLHAWLVNQYLPIQDPSPDDGPRPVLPTTFKDAVVDYSLRLLDQITTKVPADDKQLPPGDKPLLSAVLIEVIKILDVLCTIDGTLVARVVPGIKQIMARGESRPSAHIAFVRFFLHHGDVLVYDLDPLLQACFSQALLTHYKEAVMPPVMLNLCLENFSALNKWNIFTRYFPNFLKVLAWAPRTYVVEYLELLPGFVSPATYMEVFHAVLDLPCLSLALEAKPIDSSASWFLAHLSRQESGVLKEPDEAAMFAFDHVVPSTRVLAAAQVAPLLLGAYFRVMVREASYSNVLSLVKAMLERVSVLFPIESFKDEIRNVLARELFSLFEVHPPLIVDLRKDLLEFIGNRRNVGEGKEEFFVHVVWVIGEYASSASDPRCTPEFLVQYHEALELFAYEVNMLLQTKDPSLTLSYRAVHTTRLMTILVSALAKLASRCQDLIPRVCLCLTKIYKSHTENAKFRLCPDYGTKAIVDRITQLISTLQQPSIAAAILTPPPHVARASTRHLDHASSLALIRSTLVNNHETKHEE